MLRPHRKAALFNLSDSLSPRSHQHGSAGCQVGASVALSAVFLSLASCTNGAALPTDSREETPSSSGESSRGPGGLGASFRTETARVELSRAAEQVAQSSFVNALKTRKVGSRAVKQNRSIPFDGAAPPLIRITLGALQDDDQKTRPRRTPQRSRSTPPTRLSTMVCTTRAESVPLANHTISGRAPSTFRTLLSPRRLR